MTRLSKKHLLLLLFVLYVTPVLAQTRLINIQVTVLQPIGSSKTDFESCTSCDLYLFRNSIDAMNFYYAQKSFADGQITNYDITKDKIEGSTDNDGFCELNAVGDNWFIVALKSNEAISIPEPINKRLNIEIKVKPFVETLDDAVVKEKFKKGLIKVRNEAIGDTRIYTINIGIPPEQRYSNLRYGVSPVIHVMSKDYSFTSKYRKKDQYNDSNIIKKARPFLIDGENFAKTQFRKMGYDTINDPLYKYVDKDQRIKNHDTTEVVIKGEVRLRPAERNGIYPMRGLLWIENLGDLEIIDQVLIDAGYAKDKMRFLDFALPESEIDKKRYHQEPKKTPQEGSEDLQIEFVNGKAEILPTDSIGLEQLSNIIKKIEDIANDRDAQLYSVKVHGYASPEGGRAVNERLCRQRAEFIKNKTLSRLWGTDSYIEGSVASWQDVADLLRADSVADPENLQRAAQMEEVISTSKPAQLDSRIAALPFYKLLKENEDKYYKPLRKVEISYLYSTNRILTREQVIDRYNKKESLSMPYQYEYLFEYLKDRPTELEIIAKKALKTGPKYGKKPWPLAAYYLAKCYLKRDTFDLNLLSPYISLDRNEMIKDYKLSYIKPTSSTLLNAIHINSEGNRIIQWYNDEALVLQYISMLVKANKIQNAFYWADNLLPEDDPRFILPKKILQCMNGKWKNESIRSAVSATSPWNMVVVNAAPEKDDDGGETCWNIAWNTLKDASQFQLKTPRELYMKATLAHRLYTSAKGWNDRKDDKPVPSKYFKCENSSYLEFPEFDNMEHPWGAAMIKACEMEPGLINVLKGDGEFSQNYRDGFANYWNEIHPDKILK